MTEKKYKDLGIPWEEKAGPNKEKKTQETRTNKKKSFLDFIKVYLEGEKNEDSNGHI